MTETVRNCLIFISDALRWDYTPDDLLNEGLQLKTVAASIDTSTSIPSMLTGLTPPRHGVYSFNHRLPPDVTSIFDLDGFETGFFNAAGSDDGLNSVLRQDSLTQLDKLEPPFLYVERGHGGHHPYRGMGYDESLETFRKEFAGRTEKVKNYYREAIDASVERLRDRMETLADRGLLKETLIVFTSDHGELLGEDGWVGHLTPVYPEVVYVPTVFLHPRLPEDIDRDFMGHIDLLPTILSYLGVDGPDQMEGIDIFGDTPIRHRYNFAAKSIYANGRPYYYYKASSLWDATGGYVVNQSSRLWRLLSVLYLLFGRKWMSKHLRRTSSKIPAATEGYLRSRRTFGDPSFSLEEAVTYVQQAEEQRVDHLDVDLDDSVEKRLKQLGYR